MPEGVIKNVTNLKETPFSLDGIHTEVSLDVTSERDMYLLSKGLACTNCLEVFPATPEPRHLDQFVPLFDRWPINNEVMRARVMDNACPFCGLIITPDAIHTNIIDTRPKKPARTYDNLPGDPE